MGKGCSMKSTGQLGNTFLPRLISNYSRLATNPNTPTLPLYHRCGKVTNGNPTISCTIPYHIVPENTIIYMCHPIPMMETLWWKQTPSQTYGPTIFYQDVIQTSFFRINKWEIVICCKRSRKRGQIVIFVFHRHVWIHDTSRPGSAGRGDLKTNWLLFSILRICIVERLQRRSFLIIMHLVRISSLSWAGIPR